MNARHTYKRILNILLCFLFITKAFSQKEYKDEYVSFQYPANWEVINNQTEYTRQVLCKKVNFPTVYIITRILKIVDVKEYANYMRNELSLNQAVNVEPIEERYYKSHFGYSYNYNGSKNGISAWGQALFFVHGTKAYEIIKQSGSKAEFDTVYKTIENSLCFLETTSYNLNSDLPVQLDDSRSEVYKKMGYPDNPAGAYFQKGLIIKYDNDRVGKIEACALSSGVTYLGLIYGIRIGDTYSKCAELWGKETYLKNVEVGISYRTWKRDNFYIVCKIRDNVVREIVLQKSIN